MTKNQKKALSFLFHITVLVGMVAVYDAGKLLMQKFRLDNSAETAENLEIDLMAQEEKLSNEINPALAKLVQKNGDAFVFRKDFKFPEHLKVVSTVVTKYRKVRVAGTSEFGEGSMELSIRDDEVMEYEMAGDSIRFTMKEKVSEKIPNAAERAARKKKTDEALKNKQAPPETRERISDPLVGESVELHRDGKSWKTVPTDQFKTMAWGNELEDEVKEHLISNGLMARPLWFGANPMKPGEVTKLTGNGIDLVLDGKGEGSLELVLKGMEGVHGHPCAVFEVSGAYTENPAENARGYTVGGEVTVDKGRIWCSLLFPIVLRSDLDLIVSLTTKEGAKVVSQMQGAVNEKMHRNWKTISKTPKVPLPAKAPATSKAPEKQ